MKNILLFILRECPHCKRALTYINELQAENPEYRTIDMKIIDEKEEKALADSYDYYYVPTFYIDDIKIKEGVLTKEDIRDVFNKALLNV